MQELQVHSVLGPLRLLLPHTPFGPVDLRKKEVFSRRFFRRFYNLQLDLVPGQVMLNCESLDVSLEFIVEVQFDHPARVLQLLPLLQHCVGPILFRGSLLLAFEEQILRRLEVFQGILYE